MQMGMESSWSFWKDCVIDRDRWGCIPPSLLMLEVFKDSKMLKSGTDDNVMNGSVPERNYKTKSHKCHKNIEKLLGKKVYMVLMEKC